MLRVVAFGGGVRLPSSPTAGVNVSVVIDRRGRRAQPLERLNVTAGTITGGGGGGGVALPDFRTWESCRTMPLVEWFPRGHPVSIAFAFRRCSILILLQPRRLSVEIPYSIPSRAASEVIARPLGGRNGLCRPAQTEDLRRLRGLWRICFLVRRAESALRLYRPYVKDGMRQAALQVEDGSRGLFSAWVHR
ncbi:hypothetical protein PR048_008029 [Dryococelus australis]|uniref:Uncharacterized protein n=1 Tax=Dryococelus australis TaxID=614101 RepID=A0ABQ9HVX9_9NEOP|nr:hypothetical protein PR048_008029 [Dryococelus australis]